eukprot:Tbor_TRINITY_DN3887_c0_g1::TRINITY_DN3887_c0_g1_i1::g.5591::m.5591/K10410/DNALI; dynein light intermediate chain, axonemal
MNYHEQLLAPMIRFDPPKPAEELTRKPKVLRVMKPPITAASLPNRGAARPAASLGYSSDGRCNAPTASDIVSAIFPPKVSLHADGRKMIHMISMQPATRLDVIKLQETLDNRLVQRQAKRKGVCNIRLELYNDVFDELIRQITIDLPERGLLLLRIRDEARQNLNLHRLLCDAARAFAVKKIIANPEEVAKKTTIADIEREKVELQAQIHELKTRVENLEKSSQEAKLLSQREHEKQVEFLRNNIRQLTMHVRAEAEKAGIQNR